MFHHSEEALPSVEWFVGLVHELVGLDVGESIEPMDTAAAASTADRAILPTLIFLALFIRRRSNRK
jgi:hypothetical protein